MLSPYFAFQKIVSPGETDLVFNWLCHLSLYISLEVEGVQTSERPRKPAWWLPFQPCSALLLDLCPSAVASYQQLKKKVITSSSMSPFNIRNTPAIEHPSYFLLMLLQNSQNCHRASIITLSKLGSNASAHPMSSNLRTLDFLKLHHGCTCKRNMAQHRSDIIAFTTLHIYTYIHI